ncbi:MAG: DUF2062 domain-containing protein [Pseudomonadota bacterium]
MTPARRWLRARLARGVRRARVSARLWLRRHPRVSGFLERAGCLHVDEYTLARGVAVGFLVGLTPTVGAQTLLMLLLSVPLRANFPAAFIVSWINNPLTMAPLYFGFRQLGTWILKPVTLRFESLSGVEEDVAAETVSIVVGSLCVALPAAVIGYFVFLYVWRRFDLHMPAPVQPEAKAGPRQSSRNS